MGVVSKLHRNLPQSVYKLQQHLFTSFSRYSDCYTSIFLLNSLFISDLLCTMHLKVNTVVTCQRALFLPTFMIFFP